MSESAKTCSLIGVAVVLALVATFTRPRLTAADSEGKVGQPVFPDWTDAAAAKSLEITNVDETASELNDFKVADIDGRWVIPSHDDYPANAADHVFKAATSIIGLKVLAVVSDSPGDQETYGVVEPNEKTLTSSSLAGFGRLVVVQDAAGKDLARLIVGKEDKPTGEGGPSNLRFVRRAGQDRIYRVSLDTDVLTTKFQDWIDTDILALKQHWDINSLLLRDYTLDKPILRKADVLLAFDESKANWSIKKLTEFKDNKPEETKLPADEELDSTKINDLKMNLSGLKLEDAARKPAGFIEKLKTGKEYRNDPEAVESLARMRFYCVPEDHPTDIFSAGGDLTVGMKDGVEYTVRFGGSGLAWKHESGDKKSAAASKGAKHTNVERVVFVTARFNPDLIPKPVIEPLPEAKKPQNKKPDANKPDAKPSDVHGPEKKPAGDTPAAPKVDDKPANATKSSKATSRLSGELLALADPADDAKKPDDAKKADDAKQPDAAKKSDAKAPATDAKAPDSKIADRKPAEAAPADKKPDDKKPNDKKADDKKPEPGKPVAEKPKNDIDLANAEEARDAERKQIETANRQNQDRYDAAVKQGKAHAKELNNRFADWYYMISEDEYKKVHVGLSDLVKKKPGAAESGLGPAPQNPFSIPGLKIPHP